MELESWETFENLPPGSTPAATTWTQDSSTQQPYQVHSDVANLPSYVLPVLCHNQCNQCTLPISNLFLHNLATESQYHVMQDEAQYFNDLVTAESYYDQCPRSLYLDSFPSSVLESSQFEIDRGSYSVRSLYRARRLNSTGTDQSLEGEYTETTSEFDTAIMSLDPSTCFSMYQESMLFQDDAPPFDEDMVYMQDVSEQVQLNSEEINHLDFLEDKRRAEEEQQQQQQQHQHIADDPKSQSSGFGHGRLVKIFFHYFISSLVTINAYFYNYFLRYILFI